MRVAGIFFSLAAVSVAVTSCLIENDMSYPIVHAEVTAFEVEGQESVSINAEQRTVEVELGETVDMSAVKVTRFDFSETATCDDIHVDDVLDLTSPVKVVLETYQQYEWTISATQPVERYVDCRGQIYSSIDEDEKTVHVSIIDHEALSSVMFNDMKLEKTGSEITGYEGDGGAVVPVSFPVELDCSEPVVFVVDDGGQTSRWTVSVSLMSVSLAITETNVWATHADVNVLYDADTKPEFSYRATGSTSWTTLPETDVEPVSEYEVHASITGLAPGTAYTVRVTSGTESQNGDFTTETAAQLHNMSFDNWYKDGSAWIPDLDASYKVWDSANKGSSILNINPSSPTSDVAIPGGGKQAAELETMSAFGKLAAGNLYTGTFGRIVIGSSGTGAILDWGVPFSSRPSAMTGYYKYFPVTIDVAEAPYEDQKGQMDVGQIMVFLTDWDTPFNVNTLEGRFVDVDNDPSIIAFGLFEPEGKIDRYQRFRVDIRYRDMTRTPKYIVVTACASRYGNYFTGGVGSRMFVDEFEFVYEDEVLSAE